MLDQDTARAILTLADETGPGSRWWVTGTSSPPSAAAASSTSPPAGPDPRPSCPSTWSTGSPTRSTPNSAWRCVPGYGPARCSTPWWRRTRYASTPPKPSAPRHSPTSPLTSSLNGETGVLVMADTREQVAALNGAIRDRLVAAGYVDDRRGVVTGAGERLGVGDRVMTRRNDRDLAVANRDTWTITGIDHDGTADRPTATRRAGSRSLPAGLRARARGARLRHHRPRRPGRDHPHRPPAAGRAHHRRRGLRRDDPRPRGQRGPPGRREPRRRPATVGRDLRPRPCRPRTRTRRQARSRGPRAVRTPPPPRGRAGRPARRLEPPNKTYEMPWPAAESRHHFMAGYGDLPRPGVAEIRGRRSTSSVTTSPPPPTRCAPASTNPPSDPCPRAASSRNTPTGSSTANTQQQLAQAGWETAQPVPGPAAADRPTATRAHLTEAEASADDPHHRSTPWPGASSQMDGPCGESCGEPLERPPQDS